jgi:predicted O-methyltransferase YrrM
MNIRQLLEDAPVIHGDVTHGLIPEALEHIAATVKPGHRTVETGSGHSTIAFALAGAEHTCIVPSEDEIAAIRSYCEAHAVSLDDVTFHAEPSEEVLPTLDLGPLDLGLVDGSHSFPQVFIDWFYMARALKPGGTLIVDDVHVWTGRVLRDFLLEEPGWEQVTELRGRTSVFRATGGADLGRVWTDQPYVARKTGFGSPANKARQALSMVRHGQAATLGGELRSKISRGGG